MECRHSRFICLFSSGRLSFLDQKKAEGLGLSRQSFGASRVSRQNQVLTLCFPRPNYFPMYNCLACSCPMFLRVFPGEKSSARQIHYCPNWSRYSITRVASSSRVVWPPFVTNRLVHCDIHASHLPSVSLDPLILLPQLGYSLISIFVSVQTLKK